MPVAVLSKRQELLNYLWPFRIETGRLPQAGELKAIESLIGDLEKRNPTPKIKNCFEQMTGTWQCVFTNSRFVLGLDNLPLLRMSAVYQHVMVHAGKKTGHYFNIAELSRGHTVKCVCGEYASIRPSESHPTRLDVQYEWFYFGGRIWSTYEGHGIVANELEAGCLPKHLRLPFRASGWQSILYLDDELRVVQGSQGGLFVLVKCH